MGTKTLTRFPARWVDRPLNFFNGRQPLSSFHYNGALLLNTGSRSLFRSFRVSLGVNYFVTLVENTIERPETDSN